MSGPDKQPSPSDNLSYASTPEKYARNMKEILRKNSVPGAKIEIGHGDQPIKTIRGTIHVAGPNVLSVSLDNPPGNVTTIRLGIPPDESFDFETHDAQGHIVESGRSGMLKKVEITSSTP